METISATLRGCFIGVLALSLRAAAGDPLDHVLFGNGPSETAHAYADSLCQSYVGDQNQTARKLLPQTPAGTILLAYPAGIYGGWMQVKMAVDPVAQNYFTIKLSGNENPKVDGGRLILVCEGKEVGMRWGDGEEVFVDASDNPLSIGSFVYRTAILPLKLTRGKTAVTLRIRSSGRFYAYGTTWVDSTYQRRQLYPTRGVYRAYTHTNPDFALPADDIQGAMPSYTTAPGRISDTALRTQVRARCNSHILSLLSGTNALIPYANNNYNDVEYLALSYSIPWTARYHSDSIVAKVQAALDSNCVRFVNDTTLANSGWGGLYGRLGYAVHLLYPQLSPSLSDSVDFGKGKRTRRDYWAWMIFRSREYGRFSKRSITNQVLEAEMSIYCANLGLRDLDSALAFPEDSAIIYLHEGLGVSEWRGNDLPRGGYDYWLGRGYTMMTAKGTSHEPGWVSQDCYGNLGPKILDIWRINGSKDTAILGRARDLEHIMAYFRYPSVDPSGYRAILAEGVICWRNEYIPGTVIYGNPWVAADTKDPKIVGYVEQMRSDGQLSAMIESNWGFIQESKSLRLPDALDSLSKWSGSATNPTTPGQPDYAVADEENGILAVKRGDERFFIALYRRAYEINRLARAHVVSPANQRIVEFREDDVRYTKSGKFVVRDTLVQGVTAGVPPDRPCLAFGGDTLDIPLLADGTLPDQNRRIASYYGAVFGDYVIGMNTTNNASYTMTLPQGFTGGTDLVSGRTLSAPVTVGPRSTVVFYFGGSNSSVLPSVARASLWQSGDRIVGVGGSGNLRLRDARGRLLREADPAAGRVEMRLDGIRCGIYFAQWGRSVLRVVVAGS
jgi:hypothetical protein